MGGGDTIELPILGWSQGVVTVAKVVGLQDGHTTEVFVTVIVMIEVASQEKSGHKAL